MLYTLLMLFEVTTQLTLELPIILNIARVDKFETQKTTHLASSSYCSLFNELPALIIVTCEVQNCSLY